MKGNDKVGSNELSPKDNPITSLPTELYADQKNAEDYIGSKP